MCGTPFCYDFGWGLVTKEPYITYLLLLYIPWLAQSQNFILVFYFNYQFLARKNNIWLFFVNLSKLITLQRGALPQKRWISKDAWIPFLLWFWMRFGDHRALYHVPIVIIPTLVFWVNVDPVDVRNDSQQGTRLQASCFSIFLVWIWAVISILFEKTWPVCSTQCIRNL